MIATLSIILCGCQSVSLPTIDIMKSPEFTEEAANFAEGKEFPKTKDAPEAPTDVRSDREWDQDARALEALRGSVDGIKMESGPTEREAAREFNALKAKAQAYKKDDPRSGPVTPVFPKSK